MSVVAHDAGELNNEGRSGSERAAEQPMNLLEIAYIESAQGILPIGGTQQIDSGNAHVLTYSKIVSTNKVKHVIAHPFTKQIANRKSQIENCGVCCASRTFSGTH